MINNNQLNKSAIQPLPALGKKPAGGNPLQLAAGLQNMGTKPPTNDVIKPTFQSSMQAGAAESVGPSQWGQRQNNLHVQDFQHGEQTYHRHV